MILADLHCELQSNHTS